MGYWRKPLAKRNHCEFGTPGALDSADVYRSTPRPSPHISPVSRKMAPDRYKRAPGWTEGHSRSYGLREDQVRLYLDQPGPG